jgi:hypothetical protein
MAPTHSLLKREVEGSGFFTRDLQTCNAAATYKEGRKEGRREGADESARNHITAFVVGLSSSLSTESRDDPIRSLALEYNNRRKKTREREREREKY